MFDDSMLGPQIPLTGRPALILFLAPPPPVSLQLTSSLDLGRGGEGSVSSSPPASPLGRWSLLVAGVWSSAVCGPGEGDGRKVRVSAAAVSFWAKTFKV